jgi:hypothetical protein
LYFRETETSDCEDCDGDSVFVVPASTLTTILNGSSVPLCFECYVERLDRLRACATVEFETQSEAGEFVVAAPSLGDTDDLAHRTASELQKADVDVSTDGPVPLSQARNQIGDYHARELTRGVMSETRHVYAATSERGTVADVMTRTDDDSRDALAEALARHVTDTSEVRKREDVPDAVATTYPTLVEHRASRSLGVPERVWQRAKDRGVSRGSKRAERNQKAGRKFEEFFQKWCEDHGFGTVRGKTGLLRRYPSVSETVADKTDGLAGVPDYLVCDDRQTSFGDGWRPEGEAFVEVKRGTSNLSREQERVVAHLKSHGFDVYVLRGEPHDHRFERR